MYITLLLSVFHLVIIAEGVIIWNKTNILI